jgi:hypothetical protein
MLGSNESQRKPTFSARRSGPCARILVVGLLTRQSVQAADVRKNAKLDRFLPFGAASQSRASPEPPLAVANAEVVARAAP